MIARDYALTQYIRDRAAGQAARRDGLDRHVIDGRAMTLAQCAAYVGRGVDETRRRLYRIRHDGVCATWDMFR